MLENETRLIPASVSHLEKEYEEARDKILSRNNIAANEALGARNAAVAFFELGLKLGKERPVDAEILIRQIKEEIERIRKQSQEQVFPASRSNI